MVELHRDSALLAVACEDYSMAVVDIEGERVVRTFTGHTNRVTDAGWSPDGRWLITSAMDSTLRCGLHTSCVCVCVCVCF